MKILKALFSRARGADRKAAEALTDHKVEAENAIEDSKKQVESFRANTRDALASNKLLQKQLDEAESDTKKWLGIATKAAQADSEDDARSALTKKNSAEKKVKSLSSQIDQNNLVIRKCRDQIEAIENKIEAAESNVDTLAARQESAKLQQSLSGGIGDTSALDKLDDFEDVVEKEEAKAEAAAEMNTSSGDKLEDKYATDSSVDDELAALMNKGK